MPFKIGYNMGSVDIQFVYNKYIYTQCMHIGFWHKGHMEAIIMCDA